MGTKGRKKGGKKERKISPCTSERAKEGSLPPLLG
jgi:hypothetical protein